MAELWDSIRNLEIHMEGVMGETDPKLLPCPFCGGPAKTYQYNGTTQAVCCSAEYVDCPGSTCDAPVAMWNRRATAAEAEVADLRAKLAMAVEALEPFAEFARASGFEKLPDDMPMTQGSRLARRQVTAGNLRRARTALDAIKEDRT